MNILIVAQYPHLRRSGVQALRDYNGAHIVIAVQQKEDISGWSGTSRVGWHIDRAFFHIPGVRFSGNDVPHAQSQRAENMLAEVQSAREAGVQGIKVFNEFWPEVYDINTDEIVPPEKAFYRRIDYRTNTFSGCYLAPDWRRLFDELEETIARKETDALLHMSLL